MTSLKMDFMSVTWVTAIQLALKLVFIMFSTDSFG